MTTEPMIIESPGAAVPRSGGLLWTTPEMYDPVRKRPAFTVQVVAEVFFGMSAPWLRKHQRQSNESVDFGKVEPLRTQAKYHSYRLYDIERMAHVFAEHRVIDGHHLARVVDMVRLVGQLYGYLPSMRAPELHPEDELPLGHTGFSAVVPAERAAALHLLNQILTDYPRTLPSVSCAHFGDHKKTADCDCVLADALVALRKLEHHLREEGSS
jgi:hypothetical protein